MNQPRHDPLSVRRYDLNREYQAHHWGLLTGLLVGAVIGGLAFGWTPWAWMGVVTFLALGVVRLARTMRATRRRPEGESHGRA